MTRFLADLTIALAAFVAIAVVGYAALGQLHLPLAVGGWQQAWTGGGE